MARTAVRFHPRAAEEADNAHLWYQARNAHVAETFRADLDAAITAISAGARRWLRLFVRFRRLPMRRFPFSVVYVERNDTVDVIALAHHRRRPGFWPSRQSPRAERTG